MPFGHCQEQSFLRELAMRQVLVPRCDRGGKPRIQSVGQDGLNLVDREQMMHHQLYVWLPTPEFAERVRNHSMPRERHSDADSQCTGVAKGDQLGASLRLIDVLQDTSCIAQEQFPSRAQSDSSGQSVEQEEPHLPLQILDLPRQGRLSDMEARGCSSEMLLFRNADEIAQMPKLHLIPFWY